MNEDRVAADLKIRTKEFSLRIIRMFTALPMTTVAEVLGKQVLRSATSIGANLREAQRARSKSEFVSKIGDCLKELDETAYWLELLCESGILSPKKLSALRKECDELLAIFTTISKRSKSGLS
jgi:four helix bundle protein